MERFGVAVVALLLLGAGCDVPPTPASPISSPAGAGAGGAGGAGGSGGGSFGFDSGSPADGGDVADGDGTSDGGAPLDPGRASDAASGTPDLAGPVCPCYQGDGDYCGSGTVLYAAANHCQIDQAAGNEGNILRCTAGVWGVDDVCANGCLVAPPGMADVCK